ncbi:MAG: hypothetical protein HZB46_18320 [Solirubrobacterales bacterium]|nr:hypothetical protein [Solirubrobacterales bacterium]
MSDAPVRAADCEGSPAFFGFLGAVTVAGCALRVAVNLGLPFVGPPGCGRSLQALTAGGRTLTRPARTRRTGPTSLRLPLAGRSGARVPATVRLRLRTATSCPPGRRPWRYLGRAGDAPTLVVGLAW